MHYLQSKYYDFYYSKNLPQKMIDSNYLVKMDLIVEEIIQKLDLIEPERKIECFLYSSREEKTRLSHTFGHGNAIIKAYQIHCIGLGSLEHETVHILFDNQISPNQHWPFLSEGIVEYYFSTKGDNWDKLKSNINNRVNIPIERYLTDKKAFWDGSDLSYPLAGHFTRFLIDSYGLGLYKKQFVLGLENGFEEIHGKSIQAIIEEWNEFQDK